MGDCGGGYTDLGYSKSKPNFQCGLVTLGPIDLFDLMHLFAGWIMKISHLRKSMNFSSEAFYNIWRIAVRVVLPVGIILAIIAVLGQFV